MDADDSFSIPLEFKLLEREEPEIDSTTNSGIRRGRIKEDHDNPPKWTSTWIPWDGHMDVAVFMRNLKRELAAVGLAAARDIERNIKARIAEYAIIQAQSAGSNGKSVTGSAPRMQVQQPRTFGVTPGLVTPGQAFYPPVPSSSSSSMYAPPTSGMLPTPARHMMPINATSTMNQSRKRGRKARRGDDDEEGNDDEDDVYIPAKHIVLSEAPSVRTRSSRSAAGDYMESSPPPAPAAEAPPSSEKKRKSVKVCPGCESEVGITQRACPSCGHEFVRVKPDLTLGLGKGKKFCKGCNAVIASSRRECPECGITCVKD